MFALRSSFRGVVLPVRRCAYFGSTHCGFHNPSGSSTKSGSSGSEKKTSEELVKVSWTDDGKVATLQLQAPPLNFLGMEMLKQFATALDKISDHGDTEVAIIKSANPKVFSAGLDLRELYKPDMTRFKEFWGRVQEAWVSLYAHKVSTVAQIQGACPAGGLLIALACDYRIMAETTHNVIGLNEARIGLLAPEWLMGNLEATVGRRQVERLVGKGLLLNSSEALSVGMVDQVVPSDQLEAAVQEEAKSWLQVPHQARFAAKMTLRMPIAGRFREVKEQEVEHVAQFVQAKEVQADLGAYLAKLGGQGGK